MRSYLFSFFKGNRFDEISIADKLTISQRNYDQLFDQLSTEDKDLIRDNQVLCFFQNAIRDGYYSNMRNLKNDIEDAINTEILKVRGIII